MAQESDTGTPPVDSAGKAPPAAIPRRPRWVRIATRWGVGVILVGVVVNLGLAYLSIRSGAARTVEAVSPFWLLVAVIAGLVPTVMHGFRVRNYSRFLGTPTRLRGSMRAAWGTELGSSIAPKAIGGAPVKLALLLESGMTAGTATSIVLLNNLEDVLVFTVVMPLLAVLTRRWDVPEVQEALSRIGARAAGAGPWLAGGAAVVVIWLMVRRFRRPAAGAPRSTGPIREAIRRTRRDFLEAYALVGKRGKLRFLAGIGMTTFQWMARCSVGTAILYGIGRPVDPILFGLLQWVVWMTMVFVPTPGAALGAEASFAAVMSGFIGGGLLGLVAAAWRFLSFYLVLLVGLMMVPALSAGRRLTRSGAR